MQYYVSKTNYNSSFLLGFIDYLGEDSINYYFGIKFSLSMREIVRSDLNKVVITVLNPAQQINIGSIPNSDIDQIPVLNELSEETDFTYDPNMLAVLTKFNNIVANNKFQNSNIITQATVSNLFNYVPSDAVELFRTTNSFVGRRSLARVTRILEPLSQDELALVTKIGNAISAEQVRNLNLNLLTDYSLSPAEILKKENKISNPLTKQIKDFYLNVQVSSNTATLYKTKVVSLTTNTIRLRPVIPVSKILLGVVPQNSVNIKYEIYNKNNEIIETITQNNISLQNYSKLSKLIKKEPSVTLSQNQKDKVSLAATQNDRNANKISISKKTISSTGECSAFLSQANNQVLVGQTTNFSDTKNYYKSVYRFTPTYLQGTQNIISTNFKDVVIQREVDSFFDPSSLLISDSSASFNQLIIKLIDPPSYATQYKIVKKQVINDCIRHDTAQDISSFKGIDDILVVDPLVEDGETYEYTIFYKTDLGTVRKSKSYIHYYKNNVTNSVSTQVSNFTITNDVNNQIKVSFNINTNILPGTETNKIIQSLKDDGVYDELFSNTQNLNDLFQDLIYHKVTRLNLKTGERETFPTLANQNLFEDTQQVRQLNSISPIKFGNPYRYEVRVALVNINSALRDYVKVEIDPFSQNANNQIYYNPYKWKQPITRKTGMLLSQDSSNNFKTAYSFFENYEIGITATKDLTYTSLTSAITNLTVSRYQTNVNYIDWQTSLPENSYDHFVVAKEINGKRIILDVVSSSEYYDILNEEQDVGTICYYITPVLSDYSVGQTVKSSPVLIEPYEYIFST